MTPATSQTDPLRTVALLPARLASTRLPQKMLLAETGHPLFAHSARNVARCAAIERVVVATDSEEIVAAAETEGVEVLMTSPDHPSGTDRVREAVDKLDGTWDVVVNVQADEPDVAAEDLERLVAAFRDPAVEVATLCGPLGPGDPERTSVVKVVRDATGDAIYFSRAAIPDASHARLSGAAEVAAWRHVGVYAFRPGALAEFCELPVGRLEALENLEQLRWLEAGRRMRVIVASEVPRGIDTREDYDAFVSRTAADRRNPSGLERTETR